MNKNVGESAPRTLVKGRKTATCPKDADVTPNKLLCCVSPNDMATWHICTRKKGHTEKHHCHEKGKCLAVWGD